MRELTRAQPSIHQETHFVSPTLANSTQQTQTHAREHTRAMTNSCTHTPRFVLCFLENPASDWLRTLTSNHIGMCVKTNASCRVWLKSIHQCVSIVKQTRVILLIEELRTLEFKTSYMHHRLVSLSNESKIFLVVRIISMSNFLQCEQIDLNILFFELINLIIVWVMT